MLVTSALTLAAALTFAAAVTMGGTDTPSAQGLTGPGVVNGRVEPTSLGRLAAGDPAGQITSLRSRLRVTPRDHRSWSTLALAYVEQARVTADPTYYRRA